MSYIQIVKCFRSWKPSNYSSIYRNHSNDSTCAIHEENLRNYQKVALNNFQKLSIKERGYCENIDLNLNADEFDKYLKLPCNNEFLDCKSEKITKADIEALFQTTSDLPNDQNNKRSSTDTVSSNDHSGKKFVFRQSNAQFIVRDVPEPRIVQLDLTKYKESNDKLFNSFGVKQNQNGTNNLVRRQFDRSNTSSDGAVTSTNEQRDSSKNLPHGNVYSLREKINFQEEDCILVTRPHMLVEQKVSQKFKCSVL